MRLLLILFVFLWANTGWADAITITDAGVDSKVTGLNGTGIAIGQVEVWRSGKWGYDPVSLSTSDITPTGVYVQGTSGMASPTFGINTDDAHATEVAGVMIASLGTGSVGVSPLAELHSMATQSADEVDIALALNRIALLNNGSVQAINLSFGLPLQPFIEEPDGNSHFAQFIDWSARRHDVLYVAAWGNSDASEFRTPQDNFNGITVAASESPPGPPEDILYRRFSSINAIEGDASGDRTSIDLLSPGFQVQVSGYQNTSYFIDGTSYATPHVTGAAALLHQYAVQQKNASVPNDRFVLNSQRHEVMKAVMLNSADKLDGVHGSTRTIVDLNDQDWTQSEAFNSVFMPLDDQMGAGHLNVRRAVQQFAPGEYDPGTVPLIGWDYGSIGGQDSIIEYVLDEPLAAGEYIAITLAWDRRIESTGGNTYNFGDQFTNHGVANLDLRLMTKDGTDLTLDSVWSSQSFEDNVEHIFFQFNEQEVGEYKIVVHHNCCDIGNPLANTNYALAWWYGDAAIPGDYDANGSVGPEDYDLWKANFGTVFAAADGNGDGIVDAADYTVWRKNLGAGMGSQAAVPEPSAIALAVVGLLIGGLKNRRFKV